MSAGIQGKCLNRWPDTDSKRLELAKKTKKKRSKKRKKKEYLKHGEAELFGKIKNRYSPPQWATFRHVANSTGYAKKRTADAISMGLWPSQGLEIHGFEIKVSRADWQRELALPEKSAPIQRYCDRWWIVVPDAKIVDKEAGELPKTWGLLALRGQKLYTIVDAPKLRAKKLSRGFVAAVLRRAYEANQVPDLEDQVRAELREEIERSVGYGQQITLDSLRRQNEELKKKVEIFEKMAKMSGVHLSDWNYEDIAKTVGLVRGDRKNLTRQLQNIFDQLDRFHGEVKTSLEELGALESK